MAAPYREDWFMTDSESLRRTVQFIDADGPVNISGLTFEYSLDGCGSHRLDTEDGITIGEDEASLVIELPEDIRLREGTYEHGLRAIDPDGFTQQIFFGTVSVSRGGFSR